MALRASPEAPARGPALIDDRLFEEADFLKACGDAEDALIYFLLNVGDGDMQLILTPKDPSDRNSSRRAIVVDVGVKRKLPALVNFLADEGLLPHRDQDPIALVVGTHPHDDHIGGMPEFLEWYRDYIAEYWDSGYFHPVGAYTETMRMLEELRQKITLTQPTSGMTRYISTVKITTITPGVNLRNRYDTMGVNINDASIAVKLEFPASRIIQKGENRNYHRPPEPWSILLGADAQHTAWAQATVDFPELHTRGRGEPLRQMARALGRDWLRAHVFKVPHHASKHGVNVELVERIRPRISLVSSVGGGGRYGFPHALALESLREGVERTTSGQSRGDDHMLGIFFTSDHTKGSPGRALGSIALIIPPQRGSHITMWRFCDEPRDPIDIKEALRWRRRL